MTSTPQSPKNLPANRRPDRLPAGIPPLSIAKALDVTARLAGYLETEESHPLHYCVSARMAATEVEKAQISDARERMVIHLEPTDRATLIEAVIGKLLFGFDKGRGPSAEQASRLNQEFMEGIRINRERGEVPSYHPLWAVKAAADRYRSKTTLTPWDAEFRPNPGQFAAEVRAGMLPHRTMVMRADRILAARVYEPAPRLPEASRPDVIAEAMRKGAIGVRLPPNEIAKAEEIAERRARAGRMLAARQGSSDAAKAVARHERRHGDAR